MNERYPLRYFVELDGATLAVAVLDGREALSWPYRFEARIPLARKTLPEPDRLVRTPATIVLASEAGEARRIEGIVTEAGVTLTGSGAGELSLTIEPKLVLLRYRRDVRVFRDLSAVQIVVAVAAGLGVKVEQRLAGSYALRPYCVQMRESDLDFCARLLEDEGIASFVADDGSWVLCDGHASYAPLAGGAELPFAPPGQLEGHDEALLTVADHAELSAGRVSLRDFNPAHPSLPMDVSAAVAGAIAAAPERYDFPGEYLEPAAGAHRAQRWAEALRAAAGGVRGRTSCGRLAPGFHIEPLNAPVLDAPRYLVTAVEHHFEREAAGFTNAFEACPSEIPWRPARRTHVPTLPSPLTALVVGPPGADVHGDATGRVKLHFPWDRRQPRDDRASDWVPVVQDNTGQSVAVPRTGWEVLTGFLEGDPDRPVVLGRLYNGADPFPEPLPEGKTRSSLRSLSSPGRAGVNMVRFDDATGSELVTVHAERDQTVQIAHDKRQDVGASERVAVDRDETVAIAGDHDELVGHNRTEQVTGDQTLTVAGDRRVRLGGVSSNDVGGDHTLDIGGMHRRRIETDDLVQAKSLRESVAAAIVEACLEQSSVAAQLAASLTVGGALCEIARKSKSEGCKLGRVETVGGLLCSRSGKTTSASAKGRVTNVGGALTVSATGALSFDAGTLMQLSAASVTLTHPETITLAVGEACVVLGGGVVTVSAPGRIVLRVSGSNQQLASESSQIT